MRWFKSDRVDRNDEALRQQIAQLKAENALLLVVKARPSEEEMRVALLGAQHTAVGKSVYWIAESLRQRYQQLAETAGNDRELVQQTARAEAMGEFIRELKGRMLETKN